MNVQHERIDTTAQLIAWHGRVGRFRFSLRVLRHRAYPGAPFGDRWVVQPSVSFDRKAYR